MNCKRLALILLLFFPFLLIAQGVWVDGVVLDQSNRQPLAFVNILSEKGYGTTTDIDGKFSLRVSKHDSKLKLTYIGYETKWHTIDFGSKKQRILMTPKRYQLDEVEVHPGINPAHRIIDSVLANRDRNDPEKLDAFSYISYDKMIATVDADSLMKKDTALLDSTERKARAFLEKQDIFIMETVTERKYRSPGLNQENVLATRVAGFKDPMMAFMISQVQSTSFYSELISIAGKKYINPVSRGSTRKYFFMIEDTIYSPAGDSVFIISFRPMKNTKFDGMKGFLSINTDGWAIQNVKSQPANDTTGIIIRIEQAYDKVEGRWFPVQLHTDVVFLNASFAAGGNNYHLIGNGRSYIRDISLDPDLKRRDFGFSEVEIESDAGKKKGEFWKEYRVDSLTARERETYRVIDSIGKEADFDRMANTFQTLITGSIPVKFINLDLNKVIHYNNFEGIYLGLGLHTNDQLSKIFSVGGFWGYGFRDKRAKYGLDLSFLVNKRSESKITLEGYYQAIASGDVEFFDDRNQLWRPDYFYRFYISQMNYTAGGAANYTFKIRRLRDFKWNLGARFQEKQAYGNYSFSPGGDTNLRTTRFGFSELSLGFRFAYRERTIQTTRGQFSFGSDYPVVWLNFTQGINGFFNGEYTYSRFDLKVQDKMFIKYLGTFSYRITAGLVLGDIPLTNLYNGKGSYGMFGLYAPYSFGTMRRDEFYSDRYLALFLQHNFGNLLFDFKKWHPELVLVTNLGFGNMHNTRYHEGLDFNTMQHGYYESGLLIRKLLDLRVYDLGVGVLYRYGPYGFDNVSLNFAYKISLFYGF